MKKELSFLGDTTLKQDLLSEMRLHQKQDDFIKGTYAIENGQFKGCAVGCAVQSLNVKHGLKIRHSDHAALADAVKVPEWLWRLQDYFFENLKQPYNSQFAVDFIDAIPVGVNLEPVKWKFCAFILKENIERVLLLKIDDRLKEQVVCSVRDVLKLHEQALDTGKWDARAAESAGAAAGAAGSAAESAWSAAESAGSAAGAAWSAAESAGAAAGAAWSAAGAAWSAAESAGSAAESAGAAAESAAGAAGSAAGAAGAAWSAAIKRYAKKLLRLLQEQK